MLDISLKSIKKQKAFRYKTGKPFYKIINTDYLNASFTISDGIISSLKV
jgi:hypothetical protein